MMLNPMDRSAKGQHDISVNVWRLRFCFESTRTFSRPQRAHGEQAQPQTINITIAEKVVAEDASRRCGQPQTDVRRD
jgi:hypothetical protein